MTDIATIMQTSAVIGAGDRRRRHRQATGRKRSSPGACAFSRFTLRTPAAMEAIAEMKTVPGAIVGAGTVVNEAQAKAVIDAGVEFIVSPGLTEASRARSWTRASLICPAPPRRRHHARARPRPHALQILPRRNQRRAEGAEGLAAPFYQCRFCPTGGITEASAPDWLAFDPVLCVGGSWVTGGSMADVEAKARAASALRR